MRTTLAGQQTETGRAAWEVGCPVTLMCSAGWPRLPLAGAGLAWAVEALHLLKRSCCRICFITTELLIPLALRTAPVA
jgi:hypothetical protein